MAATNTISKIIFQFLLILLSSYQNIDAVYYADDGLQQTLAYRHLPARDKYEMQSEILNLLGLHRRPKPKQRITDNSAPKYLKDLYKSLLDEDSGNLKVTENDGPVVIEGETLTNNSLHAINDSDVIISFVNEFARQFSHVRHEKEKRLWFDVSEVLHSENIMDAELRLYRNLSQSLVDRTHEYKVTIYKVVKGEKSLDVELTFIAEKDLDMEEGWLMFNVTSAMKEWVSFPQQNLGFYLSVKCYRTAEEVSPHEVGLIGSNGPPDKQPFMLAFIKSSPTSHTIRIKRETQKGRRSSSSSSMDSDGWNPYLNPMDRYSGRSCQKKTLYVSFRDLGWQDWIIAPDGYAAFFCDGECSFPLNAHMNATNHAIVQTLVHLMNPHIVPKPCCAPTKLSAIMVLYFDDNSNVILKKYKNMVVKSCGCH